MSGRLICVARPPFELPAAGRLNDNPARNSSEARTACQLFGCHVDIPAPSELQFGSKGLSPTGNRLDDTGGSLKRASAIKTSPSLCPILPKENSDPSRLPASVVVGAAKLPSRQQRLDLHKH